MLTMRASKQYPVVAANPEVMLVYCSDPRFGKPIEDYTKHELGLQPGSYVKTVIAGGVCTIAHPDHLPYDFKVVRRRIRLHAEDAPNLKRLILFGHENCRYYREYQDQLPAKPHPIDQWALHDLCDLISPTAHQPFRDLCSSLGITSVEAHFARFSDDTRQNVVFERVTF